MLSPETDLMPIQYNQRERDLPYSLSHEDFSSYKIIMTDLICLCIYVPVSDGGKAVN